MQMLKELELLEFIIPELNRCVGFNQNTPYHHKDIFDHTLVVLDATPKELVIRLAALLHDIAKPICFTVDEEGRGHFYQHHKLGSELAAKILKELRYSNKVIDQVSILVKEHMQQLAEMKATTIKRFIGRLGEENIQRFFQLRRADVLGTKPPYNFEDLENFKKKYLEIVSQSQALTVKDLDINGNDLIEMGMVEGIKIGEMLEYLLGIILDQPELNKKTKLKKMVIRNFKESKCTTDKTR